MTQPRTAETVRKVAEWTEKGWPAALQAKLLGVSEHEINLIKSAKLYGKCDLAKARRRRKATAYMRPRRAARSPKNDTCI